MVLIKVALFSTVWLVIFLLTFLGYLSLPAIVLSAFLILYGTIGFVSRRIRKARRALK